MIEDDEIPKYCGAMWGVLLTGAICLAVIGVVALVAWVC